KAPPSTPSIDAAPDAGSHVDVPCHSHEVPLVLQGEWVVKDVVDDLDGDGVPERMILYEKTVPGWEGEPMPYDRFTLFTCEVGVLVASHSVDPYIVRFPDPRTMRTPDPFEFLSYKGGKALFLVSADGWYLLRKKGTAFQRLSPDAERSRELAR